MRERELHAREAQRVTKKDTEDTRGASFPTGATFVRRSSCEGRWRMSTIVFPIYTEKGKKTKRKENEVFEKENPLLYTAVILIDRKTQYCMVLHCV